MKKIMSIMCSLLFTITTMAQTVEDVTLVTSGSASTEQEATLVALRSAIEQTFGTFVSSNTTMVNDELIKDEIVSVSKGNVKKYKKLSASTLPNGQVSVRVEATISISKLISYARSKGSKAEFAGQTFAMNIKLKELRETNTIAALKHMVDECTIVAKDAFDFQVELGEAVTAISKLNQRRVPLTGIQGRHYEFVYRNDDKRKSPEEDGYYIPLDIKIIANSASSYIYDLFYNTMNSIKLSDNEIQEYRKVGAKFQALGNDAFLDTFKLPISNSEVIKNEMRRLNYALLAAAFGYKMIHSSNPQYHFVWYDEYGNPIHENNPQFIWDPSMMNLSGLDLFERGPSVEPTLFEKFKLPKGSKLSAHSNKKKGKKGTMNLNKSIVDYRRTPGYATGQIVRNRTQIATSNDEPGLIFSFITYVFIPKKSMESFNGLTIERR